MYNNDIINAMDDVVACLLLYIVVDIIHDVLRPRTFPPFLVLGYDTWYVERCLTCRIVKVEHQQPHDKMEPLEVPVWKLEEILMDFITNFPRIGHGVDSI